MTNIALDDAVFLLGESAGRPAHVIALQLFEPPEGVGADYTTRLHGDLLGLADQVKPVFRRHPRKSLTSPSTFVWVDNGLDIDYHVRRSGLPRPGGIRELLEAVSLEHGVNLFRNRPLWEYYLYEGLQDGRFATTFKTHHALADGITLAHHTLSGLSTDSHEMDCRPPWAIRPGARDTAKARSSTNADRSTLERVLKPLRGTVKFLRSQANTIEALRSMARDANAHVPFEAPRSIFNTDIGGARRFAGDKWEHARFKRAATTAGCTVNDVILSVCGGALRGFLDELGALPDQSLIAMVPVSVRRSGTEFTSGEGNAFGSILCDLGTTEPDAGVRLESVRKQMKAGKERFERMSPQEVIAVSRLIMGGAVLGSFGITGTPRQAFNLIISNVPATRDPLYLNGARMTDIYPISMISGGQALNITVTRYADHLTFGIVGDRKAVPHLQRMLIHLENAISDVEKAVD